MTSYDRDTDTGRPGFGRGVVGGLRDASAEGLNLHATGSGGGGAGGGDGTLSNSRANSTLTSMSR